MKIYDKLIIDSKFIYLINIIDLFSLIFIYIFANFKYISEFLEIRS